MLTGLDRRVRVFRVPRAGAGLVVSGLVVAGLVVAGLVVAGLVLVPVSAVAGVGVPEALQAGFNGCAGQVVKLSADIVNIDYTDPGSIMRVNCPGSLVVLDLADHVLQLESIRIQQGGFTIRDTGTKGRLKIEAKSGPGIEVGGDGLIIEGGMIDVSIYRHPDIETPNFNETAAIGGGWGQIGPPAPITITGGKVIARGLRGAGIGGRAEGGDGTSIVWAVPAQPGGVVNIIGGTTWVEGGLGGPDGGDVSIGVNAVVTAYGSGYSAVGGGYRAFGSLRVAGTLYVPGMLYAQDSNPTGPEIVVELTGRILGRPGAENIGQISGAGDLYIGDGYGVPQIKNLGAPQIENHGVIGIDDVWLEGDLPVTVSDHNYLVTFNILSTGTSRTVRVFAPDFNSGYRTIPTPPVGTVWSQSKAGLIQPFTPTTPLTADTTIYARALEPKSSPTAECASGSEVDLNVLGQGSSSVSTADRYETAVLVSRAGFPGRACIVFLASGLLFPDALTAAAVAGLQGGPVLLTRTDTLPEATKVELIRLNPERVVLVGGTGVISDQVMQTVQIIRSELVVTRLAGVDRIGTNRALMAEQYPGEADDVFITSGYSFPDALATGAVSTKLKAPLLLINPSMTALTQELRTLLKQLKPKRIHITGGGIPKSIDLQLHTYASEGVDRTTGANRYETAVLLNQKYFPNNSDVFIVSGQTFPDALTTAVLGYRTNQPIYLTNPTCILNNIKTAINNHHPNQQHTIGGPKAVTPNQPTC